MNRRYRKRGLLALLLITNPVALGACKKSSESGPAVFRDDLSGFRIAKPEGWYAQTGDELRKQAEGEAARLGDPRLGASPRGGRESIVRITRYPPGQAPEPNPTIVCTRFNLRKLPPATTAENLLRMGTATGHVEREPGNVELAGRVWRRITVTRRMRDAAGKEFEVVQQVYVTVGERWAIGLTISALREQYAKYQAAFDTILESIKFDNSSL